MFTSCAYLGANIGPGDYEDGAAAILEAPVQTLGLPGGVLGVNTGSVRTLYTVYSVYTEYSILT